MKMLQKLFPKQTLIFQSVLKAGDFSEVFRQEGYYQTKKKVNSPVWSCNED